jgi:hypothetical protein
MMKMTSSHHRRSITSVFSLGTTMLLLAILVVLSFLHGSHAFHTSVKKTTTTTITAPLHTKQLRQQSSPSIFCNRRSTEMKRNLMMMDPNDALMTHMIAPTTTVTTNIPTHETIDNMMMLVKHSSWLADATVTAVTSTASNDGGSGWWSAYLNIFKTALTLVHNTIDGPLRSVGITQTWGPSIALFTAGKS